jgi:hypothetical protein
MRSAGRRRTYPKATRLANYSRKVTGSMHPDRSAAGPLLLNESRRSWPIVIWLISFRCWKLITTTDRGRSCWGRTSPTSFVRLRQERKVFRGCPRLSDGHRNCEPSITTRPKLRKIWHVYFGKYRGHPSPSPRAMRFGKLSSHSALYRAAILMKPLCNSTGYWRRRRHY